MVVTATNLLLGDHLSVGTHKFIFHLINISFYQCCELDEKDLIVWVNFNLEHYIVWAELEAQIEMLRETQRKYNGVLRLSGALTQQLAAAAHTQRALGEAFAELAQKSPELQNQSVLPHPLSSYYILMFDLLFKAKSCYLGSYTTRTRNVHWRATARRYSPRCTSSTTPSTHSPTKPLRTRYSPSDNMKPPGNAHSHRSCYRQFNHK